MTTPRLKFDLEKKANEMLDDFPESEFISTTSTWCDPEMGGGQIVKEIENRLREYGHSDENIKSRVFGYETSDLRINFAKNEHNLAGTYKKGEPNRMKFDNIMTNSNWASDGGNKDRASGMGGTNIKLWQTALDLYINDLLKDGGNLGYVCPGTWCQGKRNPDNITNILNDIIKTYDTKTIKTDVKEKCFPKVGHKIITSFVLNKTKTHTNNVIINDEKITNFQDWNCIPKDSLSQKILGLKDFSSHEKFDFQFVRKSFNLEDTRETKSISHPNKSWLGRNKFKYVSEKTKFDSLPKVVIYRMGDMYNPNEGFIIDDVGELTPSYSSVYILKEKEKAKNVEVLFNLNFYKFLMNNISTTQYNEASILNLLPKLDLSKTWNDEEVYNKFGISIADRETIDATFKK